MPKQILKREKWKNKYVWVVRDNGKLVSWTRYNPKTTNKKQLLAKFEESKSLNPKILKKTLLGTRDNKKIYQVVRANKTTRAQVGIIADVWRITKKGDKYLGRFEAYTQKLTSKTRENEEIRRVILGKVQESGIFLESDQKVHIKIIKKTYISYEH